MPRIFEGQSFTVALFSGSEKLYGQKRGGVYPEFPSKIFCLTVPEKFRRGFLYCCINFGYRKSLDKRSGEYSEFLSKIFCLTVPKSSVRESFHALISSTEKVWRRGGEYQAFPSENFCLTVPKVSVGESLDVALISGSEKVSRQRMGGEFAEFLSKFFRLTVAKDSVRNL